MSVETDLICKPAANTSETLAAFRAIDKAVLDFERDADHNYLLNDRQAYLYYRDGKAVGYGYMGNGTGPIALLRESDFPAVLAQAENEATRRGEEQFALKAPLINRVAVSYLLDRRYQLGDFLMLFMSDRPFGKFENYIIAAPPLFF